MREMAVLGRHFGGMALCVGVFCLVAAFGGDEVVGWDG